LTRFPTSETSGGGRQRDQCRGITEQIWPPRAALSRARGNLNARGDRFDQDTSSPGWFHIWSPENRSGRGAAHFRPRRGPGLPADQLAAITTGLQVEDLALTKPPRPTSLGPEKRDRARSALTAGRDQCRGITEQIWPPRRDRAGCRYEWGRPIRSG